MIYIYNDYGGTHTTSLAAAYHLKQLKQSERELTKEEILNVNYFNKLDKEDSGKLIFRGIDEQGDAVYTLGRRNSKLVVPALRNLSLMLQSEHQLKERIIFSNTSPTVPLVMSVGGFLCKALNANFVGVPLLVIGAKQCCDNIFRLVEHTKQTAREKKVAGVVVLDNKKFK